MPVKASQIVKTLELPVSKLAEDGSLAEDTLKPKYRPVTQAWIDRWAEQEFKEAVEAQRRAQLLRAVSTAARALEVVDDEAERPTLEAALEAAKKEVEEFAREHPAPEFDILSRQMADILTDLDHLEDDGSPMAVTPENLATRVDREFVVRCKEDIEKKLSLR